MKIKGIGVGSFVRNIVGRLRGRGDIWLSEVVKFGGKGRTG
jgi:hypothetical protein